MKVGDRVKHRIDGDIQTIKRMLHGTIGSRSVIMFENDDAHIMHWADNWQVMPNEEPRGLAAWLPFSATDQATMDMMQEQVRTARMAAYSPLRIDMPPTTAHICTFKPYVGLTESYNYCTICDKKE